MTQFFERVTDLKFEVVETFQNGGVEPRRAGGSVLPHERDGGSDDPGVLWKRRQPGISSSLFFGLDGGFQRRCGGYTADAVWLQQLVTEELKPRPGRIRAALRWHSSARPEPRSWRRCTSTVRWVRPRLVCLLLPLSDDSFQGWPRSWPMP